MAISTVTVNKTPPAMKIADEGGQPVAVEEQFEGHDGVFRRALDEERTR